MERQMIKTLILFLLLTIPVFGQLQSEAEFNEIFNNESLAEKREIWRSLTPEQKVDVWRLNFQWGIEHLNLTTEQLQYVAALSNSLPTITMEEARKLEREAHDLFPNDKATLLVGTIGPFVSKCNVFVKASFQPTSCPCSIGSGFNMSCDGECMSPNGRCTTTLDGCGFAWMYACSGWCQAG